MYIGTIGFFLMLMFLFVRVLPAISIFEMREVVHHLEPHIADDGQRPRRRTEIRRVMHRNFRRSTRNCTA